MYQESIKVKYGVKDKLLLKKKIFFKSTLSNLKPNEANENCPL